jgi:hypothetical protein
MKAAKVNYETLEREYVTSLISIRKLADKYGMSWSTVAERARRPDKTGKTWSDKRIEFRTRVSEKQIEKDASKYVRDVEELEYEQLQAARAIIFAGLDAIRRGDVTVQPRDITQAINVVQLLTGKATERTEATVVGNAIPVTGPDPEFLRRLEELSRGALDEFARSPRLRIEGSKPN